MSSVYERRGLSWRDRLRRLFGRENRGREIHYNESGAPILVVARGDVIGVRATDGSMIPLPEPPEPRLEDIFDREPDREWILVGGRWREKWR